MDFRAKIDNVLKAKGFKLWKLAEVSGLDSTLEKAYKENREMREGKTDEFLQKLGITKKWWDTGEEPMFNIDPEKIALPEVQESVYRDLIEKNTEYRLIPKTILDEEYRIILKSEIDLNQQMLKDLLDAKNELIKELKQEIAVLRSTQRVAPAK